MPDHLYLSLWLRGFNQQTMLRHLQELLHIFPFSRLRPGISSVRIYAIEFTEPASREEMFAGAVDVEAVLRFAREYEAPDCAYIVDGWWELWNYDGGDWRLTPSRVAVVCFGPQFDNDVGDHLRLDLGPESSFLPVAGVPLSARKTRSNLSGLVRLAREIEAALPVDRRNLWSESGENFAEHVEALSDEAGS
jgi:hypothetical protein